MCVNAHPRSTRRRLIRLQSEHVKVGGSPANRRASPSLTVRPAGEQVLILAGPPRQGRRLHAGQPFLSRRRIAD